MNKYLKLQAIIFSVIDELAKEDTFVEKNSENIKRLFDFKGDIHENDDEEADTYENDSDNRDIIRYCIEDIVKEIQDNDTTLLRKIQTIIDVTNNKVDKLSAQAKPLSVESAKCQEYRNLLRSFFESDPYHKTLMDAIRTGKPELVGALIGSTIALNSVKQFKDNCLGTYYLPALEQKDHAAVVKLLLEKKVPFKPKERAPTLLQILIDKNANASLAVFMEMVPTEINTLIGTDNALLYALKNNKLDAAKLMLEGSDIDINFVNAENKNALHIAVEMGNVEFVKILLEKGVYPHVMDKTKRTPLDIAEKENKEEMIALFKQHKSSVYTQSRDLQSRLKSEPFQSPVLSSMLEGQNEIHQSPNLSLFAHINSGYKMRNTKLEGNVMQNTSSYLLEILERNKANLIIPKEKMVLVEKALTEIRETSREIDGNKKGNIGLAIQKMMASFKENSSLTVGGGFIGSEGGHAMVYRLEKIEGKVLLKIYNTGAGIEYHEEKGADSRKRYHCFKAYEFNYNESNITKLLEKIASHNVDPGITTREMNEKKVYFDITGFEDWKVQRLPNDQKYDIHTTPGKFYDNNILIYKDDKGLAHYALISNGVLIEEITLPWEMTKKLSNIKIEQERDSEILKYVKETYPGLLHEINATERKDLYESKTFIMPQQSGNCSYKVIQSALLKDLLTEKEYCHTKLIVRLQSLLDFVLEHQSIGDLNNPEIKREIDNAIEKTAKFLINEKESLNLSQADSIEVLRFLETIQLYADEKEQKVENLKRAKIIERLTPTSKEMHLQNSWSYGPIIWPFKRERAAERKAGVSREYTIKSISDIISISEDFPNSSQSEEITKRFGESPYTRKKTISNVFDAISLTSIDDITKLDSNTIVRLLNAMEKYLSLYTRTIRKDFIPEDTPLLKKMLLIVEKANVRFNELHDFSQDAFFSNFLMDNLKKLENNNLYSASASDKMIDNALIHTHHEHGKTQSAEPLELLKALIERSDFKIEEYLDAAIEEAKRQSMFDKKVAAVVSRETIPQEEQERLVANFVAHELSNSHSPNYVKLSEQLPPEILEQFKAKNTYHSAINLLRLGGLLQDKNSCPTVEFGSLKLKATGDPTGKFEYNFKPYFSKENAFVSEDDYKPIIQDLYYPDSSKTVFDNKKDFLNNLHFTQETTSANDIQVHTAIDKSNIKNIQFREILHTRSNPNTQFIKTIDYMKNNMDKIADPDYQKLIWINLFNTQAIKFAKVNQLEAFETFFDLLETGFKKHIDGEFIDKCLLNLFDIYAFMRPHLIDMDNDNVNTRMQKLDERIITLISNYNPENREFTNDKIKKNAYITQSRLYRTAILMLGDKKKLEPSELALYLQAKIFLGKFPYPPDMLLLKKLLDNSNNNLVMQLHHLKDNQLQDLMRKFHPEINSSWTIEGSLILNKEAKISVDISSGITTVKAEEICCVPEAAYTNPSFKKLFPEMDFTAKVNYYDDQNTHFFDYISFESNGNHVRFALDSSHRVVQKAFDLKNRESLSEWWELIAHTNTGESDPSQYLKNLPRILHDKTCDVWANFNNSSQFLITKQNGKEPKYLYSNKEIYLIQNNEVTDYKFLSLDNPDYLLSRFADFESPEYIMAWHSKTVTPSVLIELPRYNLSFKGEQTTSGLEITSDIYPGYKVDLKSVNDINENFKHYIKLIPIDPSSNLATIVLTPNQQFLLKPETDKQEQMTQKHKPLTLDLNDCFHDENEYKTTKKDEKDYKPFKHDCRKYDYENSQLYSEFVLKDAELISKSQGDLLHAIYIYLGSHDYEKAFLALEDYIKKEGGFTGSVKELQMLNWILNDIPRNIFDERDPRYKKAEKTKLNHPTLIAIKLKLATQLARYLIFKEDFQISEEEKERFKIKPWEGLPKAINKQALKQTITDWLALYARQFKNIPVEMRLLPLDESILLNLMSPDAYTDTLEEDASSPTQSFDGIKIDEREIPKTILRQCKDLKMNFDIDYDLESKQAKTDLFATPSPTAFTTQAIARANEDYHYARAEYEKLEQKYQKILNTLMEKPVGSNVTNIERLVEDTKVENTNLKKDKNEIKKQMLKLANSVLTSNQYRTEILAKRRKTVSMSDLNRLFIQNNLVGYENDTLLSPDKISQLRQLHTKYLYLKSQQAMNTKFLDLTKNKINSREELEKIVPDIYKWHLQERVYDVDRYPEFLLFEALEGVLISKKQYEILISLLSTTPTGEFKSQVMQLIMGGGKSKVLLPLLALRKAKGNNLSIIIVPDALLNTNYADMAKVAKRLFNQDIYPFYFNRNGDYSPSTLSAQLNQLKVMIKNKSFVVMNKTSLEDLELKMLELEKTNHEKDKDSISLMKNILFLIRNQGDVLIDEVHDVHDIRVERNFSLAGFSENLNTKYIEYDLSFINFFKNTPFKDSNLYDFISKPDASFTQEELDKLLEECTNILITNQSPENPLFHLFTTYPMISIDEWKGFLKGETVPEQFASIPNEEKASAYIIKEQMSNLLKLTLSRDPLVHYGPTKLIEELNTTQGALAKPYRYADVVSENSQFTSPFETMNYTIFYHLKYGITPCIFKHFVEAFQKQAKDEKEASPKTKRIIDTKSAKRFREISGLNPELLNTELSYESLNELYEKNRYNAPLVQYCLLNYILPEISIDTLLLRHNSINHASQFKTVQGFSGTVLSPDIFDPRMQPFDYDLAKGTDGETIHHLVRKKTPVVKLQKYLPNDICDELISQMKENTSSIIDVGGTLKGLSNKMIALRMAMKPPNKKIEYVLYFNDQDKLTAMPVSEINNPHPKTILIGSTDPDEIKKKLKIESNEQYLVYYDQSHTIGIDIKQPPNANSVVTCGHSTLLSKLLQGVMRMRALAMNQTITLVVDQAVQSDINKEEINLIDILNYTFQIQLDKIAKDNVMATRYMLANVVRNQLIEKMLASNDHRYFTAFEDILFDKQVMDVCQLFSSVRKMNSTSKEFEAIRDTLLKTFKDKAAALYSEDELIEIIDNMQVSMNTIIAKQIKACPDMIDTSANENYGQETLNEADVTKEKEMEKDVDTNIEMEMQMAVEAGKYKKSDEISWFSIDEFKGRFIEKYIVDPLDIEVGHNSVSFDLFKTLTSYLPDYLPMQEKIKLTSLFSSNLLLSVNQRLSANEEDNQIFHSLKKPVECILWTEYLDSETNLKSLRACLISSKEYSALKELNLLPENSWVESQLGTCILGKKHEYDHNSELHQLYSSLSAQIAFYNCDIKSLTNNKHYRKWMLQDNFELKMQFLKTYILPFHPDQRKGFDRFQAYFENKHKKSQSKVSHKAHHRMPSVTFGSALLTAEQKDLIENFRKALLDVLPTQVQNSQLQSSKKTLTFSTRTGTDYIQDTKLKITHAVTLNELKAVLDEIELKLGKQKIDSSLILSVEETLSSTEGVTPASPKSIDLE